MPPPPELPPSPAPPTPAGAGYRAGDVIAGKYQLVRVLGQGGMGIVWVARDTVLDVKVAIKLIAWAGKGDRAKLTKRMLQEARTAAKVRHSAICHAYDFGETARRDPYVVSELLEGETLAERIEREGRIPAIEAVRILLPIVSGLQSAHSRGVVHRDVKPDNIFLSHDLAGRTQPKLLDFGVARFVGSDTKLTVDGTLLGTPDYMSPEQARGQGGVDGRSDVWSLCVVLYHAMTDRLPFTGDSYNGVLWSVVNEAPEPITELGAGDTVLWRVLDRGLRKNREERWESMYELGEALALWAYDNGVRDDVCGTSLKTTWIDTSQSDLRIDLPDSVPPGSQREDPRVPPSAAETLPPPGPPEAQPSTLAGRASTRYSLPPGRRRAILAVVGAMLVASGIGIGLGLGVKKTETTAVPSAPTRIRQPTAPAAPGADSVVQDQERRAPEESAPAESAPSSSTSAASVRPQPVPRNARQKPGPRPTVPTGPPSPQPPTPATRAAPDDLELGF